MRHATTGFFIFLALAAPAAQGESPRQGAPPPGAQSPAAQDASVESFFQIDPQQRNSAQSLLRQPATASTPGTARSRSVAHRLYRCIWHILDNAGVPMFLGGDPYIDPGISGRPVLAPPALPAERAAGGQAGGAVAEPAAQPGPAAAGPAPQKIPESELEGVPLPAPR